MRRIKRHIKNIDRSGLSRLMPIKISRARLRRTDKLFFEYKGVLKRTEETLRNGMKISYLEPENWEKVFNG